ncbi:MAG: TraB/TrbI/VirB10 family type IV secretion system protein [Acidobacteriaceae bacterium]
MAEENLIQEIETQKIPPNPQIPNAPLRDQRSQPPGVVAKQSQSYLIAGLSVVILLAVLFSKNHAKPAAKPLPSAATAPTTEASQRNIERFQEDLTAEQRQVEAQRQAGQQSAAGTNLEPGGLNEAATAANTQRPLNNQPPRDPIADAERALAFKSRFASNLVPPVTTSSHDNMARSPWQQNPGTNVDSESASSPALPQPLMTSSGTAVPLGLPRNANSSATSAANGKRPPEVNLNSAHGQPYVLFEGTILDTALLNRLVGDFAGPVKVMVTNPVYSQDRQHVLIPAGTFLLGDVQKVSGFGQRRLAVRFHRMLMPDGYSVDLDQFQGLDQAGATGLSDQVNNHYVQIFGASIALGVISGAAEATMYGSGYNISGPAMYEQGVASSLSQSGADVLDRFINILPTITIREGHRIKVYLTQDMLLPAYENHTMPGDF